MSIFYLLWGGKLTKIGYSMQRNSVKGIHEVNSAKPCRVELKGLICGKHVSMLNGLNFLACEVERIEFSIHRWRPTLGTMEFISQ